MTDQRRLRLVVMISVALAATAAVLALAGQISWSAALWSSGAVAVTGFVAARFKKHAELPDSVRLH